MNQRPDIPAVTVLLPVYNAAAFVGEAIRSVLAQTYRDFELLVIDDASTDDSEQVVRQFKDARIRYLVNESNLGITGTLNRGLSEARGDYIARMDADDICHPQRLARQAGFLDRSPGVAACGTWVRVFGRERGVLKQPCGAACVRASLCLDNPLFHPTVMLRRRALEKRGLRYDPASLNCEDFDLWSRLAETDLIDNLPVALLDYRTHGASITAGSRPVMETNTLRVLQRELARLGLFPDEGELKFHRRVGHGERLGSRSDILRAEQWLLQVLRANETAGTHEADAMRQAVGFAWRRLCAFNTNQGLWIWRAMRGSPLSESRGGAGLGGNLRFWVSLLWQHYLKK